VLTAVDNRMPIMQQEIFGPVVPVMTVTDFDEGLKRRLFPEEDDLRQLRLTAAGRGKSPNRGLRYRPRCCEATFRLPRYLAGAAPESPISTRLH
jgi:hypothetical protein